MICGFCACSRRKEARGSDWRWKPIYPRFGSIGASLKQLFCPVHTIHPLIYHSQYEP